VGLQNHQNVLLSLYIAIKGENKTKSPANAGLFSRDIVEKLSFFVFV
jgi:hypothetical protein